MPTMEYSKYQQDIFAAVQDGTRNVLVQALAGSGKTSTIEAAARQLPSDTAILAIAFNKKIVTELQSRMPSNVVCGTFNSVGHRVWSAHAGRPTLDANKIGNILRGSLTYKESEMYGGFVRKMVDYARGWGLTPEDAPSVWRECAAHFALYLDHEDADMDVALRLSRQTLITSIDTARNLIDFNDQIYMPWLSKCSFPQYDKVLADEAQDFNSVQAELLGRMVRPGGQLVLVGDENQAIYGFRGADANSMRNLAKRYEVVELPLSVCYRCARSVVELAATFVPAIECAETAPVGTVEAVTDFKPTDVTDKDAILCRNNAPLISMAYKLLGEGIGVNFVGRDVGASLRAICRKWKIQKLDAFWAKADTYFAKQIARLLAEDDSGERADLIRDQQKCLRIISDNLDDGQQTVQGLINAIDSLFAGGRGVTLCSVHRSKGSEWDTVYILDWHLMPSKFATREWQRLQERNLQYVAVTRAQTTLRFITS